MPIITSSYRPSGILTNAHIATVAPMVLCRGSRATFRRETIETADGDILDLDWMTTGARRIAIISHGLEGSTTSNYVIGMSRVLAAHGWDVLAWNMRGCSGTPNRLATWYHSGFTDDLRMIISAYRDSYDSIALIGFSVGGNVTLKYLGEEGAKVDSTIRCAAALSVPVDLAASADVLADRRNRHYMRYLLAPLRRRIMAKAAAFPDRFDTAGLAEIRTFHEFDRRYTAPMHGFVSVEEYWELSSSVRFLDRIRVPALLVNAADDPFLAPSCFPVKSAEASSYFHLEVPAHGGHVGFLDSVIGSGRWSERRILQFIENPGAS